MACAIGAQATAAWLCLLGTMLTMLICGS